MEDKIVNTAIGIAKGMTQRPAPTMRSITKRNGITAINSTPSAVSVRCFFKKKMGIRTTKQRRSDATGKTDQVNARFTQKFTSRQTNAERANAAEMMGKTILENFCREILRSIGSFR